jgi:hypothetical protein
MADNEPTTEQGAQWDDPNRQAVGLDPAWVEGTGGEAGDPNGQVVEETPDQQPVGEQQPVEGGPNLDQMTKDELLVYGQQLGITPMNASMSKEEIRTAIEQHRG